MASNSPSPDSPPAVPPPSITSASPPSVTTPPPSPTTISPPPSSASPPSAGFSPPSSSTATPPDSTTASPPPQPNANPPQEPTLSTPPPLQSPPATRPSSPPTAPTTFPPPPVVVPPPQASGTPPVQPPLSSPPSPPLEPPASSPPPERPPLSNPPVSSPSPPSGPPADSPPPPQPPPSSNPGRPASPPSEPPGNSPPPKLTPPSNPPGNTPLPPSRTPISSPPPPQPPSSNPPRSSPSPPPRQSPPDNFSPSPPLRQSPPDNFPPPPQSSATATSSPPSASMPTPRSPPPPPIGNSLPPPLPPPPPPPPNPPENVQPPTPGTVNPPPLVQLAPPPPPTRFSPPARSPIPVSNNPSINSPFAPEGLNSKPNKGIGTGAAVAIGVVGGIIGLSLVGLAFWFLWNRRKKNAADNCHYPTPPPYGSSTQSDSTYTGTQSTPPILGSHSGSSNFAYSSSEPSGLGNSRSWFTYEELVKATNGFSSQNLLGEGGFGSVYKGYLPDGRVVAVKQLKVGGHQGEREFKAEVEIISRIHHRHLVSLVGYCIAESQKLLVYDYIPNNTLYFHLHGEGNSTLDWATRVKIAAGAARGIAYLHEDCHPRIIHRDIKSSNILLDNNFEARVSDFGLAKIFCDANSHVTTRVMGTFGYLAPEYASSGKLTEKSDVYSFGVVLLELITGRKPVDTSQPLGSESLVEWARPLLSHALGTQEFEGLVDPRLEKNYVESEMFRMIEAAAACVRHSAAKRPRMGQIVWAFDSLATSDLSNGMKLGESEKFYSAEQSAEIRLFQRMAFGSQDYSTDFFSQDSLNTK